MKSRHRLSDGLFDDVYSAVTNGRNWIAYPSTLFYLQKGDLYFFRTPADARRFIDGSHPNKGYAVTFAYSVLSLYRELEGTKTINNQIQSSINDSVMNEKNLAYLKDQLKFMGFGDKLNEALEKELAKGSPNFQLTLETEIDKKAFAAVLNFRKSDHTDLYFFNSYHATLGRKDGEVVDQAFYVKDGKGITAKEAFNLLDGRAVHKELTNKEGTAYRAWVQIDFQKRDQNNNHELKQFHEAYGFDLAKALQKYPIKEMQEGDKKEALLKSLEKGNLQAVTFTGEGRVDRMFVEAAPQYKSINVYDNQLKRVQKEELHVYTGKGQEKEVKQGQKQGDQKQNKQTNGSVIEKPKPKSTKRSIGR